MSNAITTHHEIVRLEVAHIPTPPLTYKLMLIHQQVGVTIKHSPLISTLLPLMDYIQNLESYHFLLVHVSARLTTQTNNFHLLGYSVLLQLLLAIFHFLLLLFLALDYIL